MNLVPPVIINTAEGELGGDHIEVDDSVHSDSDGVPGENLKSI